MKIKMCLWRRIVCRSHNKPFYFLKTTCHSNIPCILRQIICGQNCTFLMQSNGCVYACGEGSYGRLGQGNSDDLNVLTIISGLQGLCIRNSFRVTAAVVSIFFWQVSLSSNSQLRQVATGTLSHSRNPEKCFLGVMATTGSWDMETVTDKEDLSRSRVYRETLL